jgi:hypothetical protein
MSQLGLQSQMPLWVEACREVAARSETHA